MRKQSSSPKTKKKMIDPFPNRRLLTPLALAYQSDDMGNADGS